jgi:uncharacterized protein involved in cysteine biosynthesis
MSFDDFLNTLYWIFLFLLILAGLYFLFKHLNMI